jgi:crossover junction endodeoxyribonuclease RuvC
MIDGEGEVIGIGDLPVFAVAKANRKLRTELDIHGLCSLLREAQVNRAVVEQVSAMPKQGVTSTFRFGYAAGSIYGAVAALALPVRFVTPQRWQQYHRIGRGPDDAVRRVVQLYPALHEQLNRKRDHHRADAVLIALYGLAIVRGNTNDVERHPVEHTARPTA